MMSKRLSILYVPIFLAGAVIGYIAKPESEHFSDYSASTEYADLLKENQRLAQRISVLENSNSAVTADSAVAINTKAEISTTPIVNVQGIGPSPKAEVETGEEFGYSDSEINQFRAMEAEHQSLLAEEHLQSMTEQYGDDVIAAFQANFENETIDGDWSYAQEDAIFDTFANTASLSEISLVASECKQTQCKISILAEAKSDSFTEIDQVYQSIGKQGGWDGYYTVVDPVTGIRSLYIQRANNADSIAQ